MRDRWALMLVCWLLLAGLPLSAADGMFQGLVVDPPVDSPSQRGWIFVQGRNHMLRRVEVSHAVIVVSHGNLPERGRKCHMECLAPGQEVRVTAEQDSDGEWRAKKVEILRWTTNRTRKGRQVVEKSWLTKLNPRDLSLGVTTAGSSCIL